ncbi:unnamed protein product [Discula destructiva]
MTTNGVEGMAGLRHQIIENCSFFVASRGFVRLIVTHEPIGTYKAIAVAETRRHRDVVLSSDGSDTVHKALEHLLTRSADAVQQFIATHGFDRLPSNNDNDDDGVSSVSSYADEADKNRLADSSLSLESEAESAYESHSDDDESTVRSSRTWTGGRRRSYDVRTVRRDGRSRSRSRSRERAPAYRKAPAPPPRQPAAHPDQAHGNRAVYPPRPYPGPAPPGIAGNGDMPPPTFAFHSMQMPPLPMGRPREAWSDQRGLPDARFPPVDARGAQWQRALEQAHQNHAGQGFVNLDNGKVGGPGPQAPLPPHDGMLPLRSGFTADEAPWPHFFPSPGSGMQGGAPMLPPMNWRQGPQMMPQRQPISQPKIPMKASNPAEDGATPTVVLPAMNSSASSSSNLSSVSSTPTIAINPITPPEYTPTSSPAKIDYKLVIKAHIRSGVKYYQHSNSSSSSSSTMTQHRVIARTPPTMHDIIGEARRNVMQNRELFPPANAPLRIRLTRVVFGGREDGAFDLSSYAEDDLSSLCESMKSVGGWPLFEVEVGGVPAFRGED